MNPFFDIISCIGFYQSKLTREYNILNNKQYTICFLSFKLIPWFKSLFNLHGFTSVLLMSFLFVQVFFTPDSYAENLDTLYEASVLVAAEESENELIAKAFTQVLIKVSGRSDVMRSAAYKSMLKKSSEAISQFRYDYKDILDTETALSSVEHQGSDSTGLSSEKPQEKKEKWFWVQFNSTTIDQLLKDAQLPVWGKTRPTTLIWISREVRGQRSMLSQYEAPGIYKTLQRQAKQRGISLMFPFYDLQDNNNISVNDIWGNFSDTILLASRRYQAQSTVTMRLFQEKSGLWISQWNLLLLGQSDSWTMRHEKRSRALSSGIDRLADKLSRQFTQVYDAGDNEGILIQINNVRDFKAYQMLDDYLNNLATVKAVNLMQVEYDRLIYKIIYLGNKNTFIQEIHLGDMLNSVERSGVEANNANKDYKPVILDNLDKTESAQNRSSQNSEGIKYSKLDKTGNSEQSQTHSEASDAKTQLDYQAPPAVIVEELIPELEYWFAR